MVQNVDAFIQHGQDPLCIRQKLLPIDRQLDVPAVLFKELDAQLLFQLLNGIAQAGLSNVELCGRLGIVQDVSQSLKILQLQKCHRNHLYLL